MTLVLGVACPDGVVLAADDLHHRLHALPGGLAPASEDATKVHAVGAHAVAHAGDVPVAQDALRRARTTPDDPTTWDALALAAVDDAGRRHAHVLGRPWEAGQGPPLHLLLASVGPAAHPAPSLRVLRAAPGARWEPATVAAITGGNRNLEQDAEDAAHRLGLPDLPCADAAPLAQALVAARMRPDPQGRWCGTRCWTLTADGLQQRTVPENDLSTHIPEAAT